MICIFLQLAIVNLMEPRMTGFAIQKQVTIKLNECSLPRTVGYFFQICALIDCQWLPMIANIALWGGGGGAN